MAGSAAAFNGMYEINSATDVIRHSAARILNEGLDALSDYDESLPNGRAHFYHQPQPHTAVMATAQGGYLLPPSTLHSQFPVAMEAADSHSHSAPPVHHPHFNVEAVQDLSCAAASTSLPTAASLNGSLKVEGDVGAVGSSNPAVKDRTPLSGVQSEKASRKTNLASAKATPGSWSWGWSTTPRTHWT